MHRLADCAAEAPQLALLALGHGQLNVGRARVHQDLAEPFGVALDGLLVEAVRLDKEVRVGVGRAASCREPFRRDLGRAPLHELAGRRLAPPS